MREYFSISRKDGYGLASGSWANGLGIYRCSCVRVRRFSRKEDISAVTSEWGRALAEDNPEKVLPFYADDAVLWGTLSPMVRADRGSLRDYFVTAFKVLPGLKVMFGDQLIRVYGNAAVNTGYYTFSYAKDGEVKTLPARPRVIGSSQ
jgi:hypothetical protein